MKDGKGRLRVVKGGIKGQQADVRNSDGKLEQGRKKPQMP